MSRISAGEGLGFHRAFCVPVPPPTAHLHTEYAQRVEPTSQAYQPTTHSCSSSRPSCTDIFIYWEKGHSSQVLNKTGCFGSCGTEQKRFRNATIHYRLVDDWRNKHL